MASPKVLAFINPAVSTGNVGDLFIVDSLKRIVACDRDQSFDVDPREPVDDSVIDRINREADAAIICGTNLWYRRMVKRRRWTFSLEQLRRIKVPIIPLGVGTTRHFDEADDGFEPQTLAQLRHIHAGCAVGSARDVRTAEALAKVGIRNVAMTGCPTLFRSLKPRWELRRNDSSNRVVVTVRKGAARNVRELIRQLEARGLEPVIAAQQDPDLAFRRRTWPGFRKPVRTLYTYDIKPYLDLVEGSRGAIGWRLHGNMLHLAHGNPAILCSNCSRGDSFCETFGLPRTPSPDGVTLPPAQIAETIDRLLDPVTFAALPGRYGQYRAAMARFLEANGLEHNLRDDDATPVCRALGTKSVAVTC